MGKRDHDATINSRGKIAGGGFCDVTPS